MTQTYGPNYSSDQDLSREGRRHREYLEQKNALQDDYGNWEFDENGYFRSLPGRRVGLEAQYATDAFVARRNRESREAAIGAMRKGMGLLESYRPGGQASLASGMYQGLAEYHYRNQIETPDQLVKWRDAIRKKAQNRATQARTMQAIAAGVATIATFGVGLAAGVGAVGAAAYGLSAGASAMSGGGGGGAGGIGGAGMMGGAPRSQPGVAKTTAPSAGIPGQSSEQQFLGGAPAGFYGAPGGGGLVGGGGQVQQPQDGQKRLAGGPGVPGGGQPGGAPGGGAQVQQGGGGSGAAGAQGGSAMSRGGAFGLAPEAPEAPMTAHGLPATPAAYMVGEDSAPQHAAYWQSQLDGLDSFFGGLMQMMMA
jgi:hypothetical protein